MGFWSAGDQSEGFPKGQNGIVLPFCLDLRPALEPYESLQIIYGERHRYATRKAQVKTFGERLRELRRARGLSQRGLAKRITVSFTYISRCETGTLDFGRYPSEELIRRLAAALEADEDELLVLAKKVLPVVRERVLERFDVFSTLARLDDETLDSLVAKIGSPSPEPKRRRRKGQGPAGREGANDEQ